MGGGLCMMGVEFTTTLHVHGGSEGQGTRLAGSMQGHLWVWKPSGDICIPENKVWVGFGSGSSVPFAST